MDQRSDNTVISKAIFGVLLWDGIAFAGNENEKKCEREEKEKRSEMGWGAVYIPVVTTPKRKGRPASRAKRPLCVQLASTPIVPAISGIRGETPLGTPARGTTVFLYKVLNLFPVRLAMLRFDQILSKIKGFTLSLKPC